MSTFGAFDLLGLFSYFIFSYLAYSLIGTDWNDKKKIEWFNEIPRIIKSQSRTIVITWAVHLTNMAVCALLLWQYPITYTGELDGDSEIQLQQIYNEETKYWMFTSAYIFYLFSVMLVPVHMRLLFGNKKLSWSYIILALMFIITVLFDVFSSIINSVLAVSTISVICVVAVGLMTLKVPSSDDSDTEEEGEGDREPFNEGQSEIIES